MSWVGGSSPLTRGKPRLNGGQCRSRGLIPTHAGKTCQDGTEGRRAGAHPHSRGENSLKLNARRDLTGSSPLTRGKLPILRGKFSGPGLIPTHAGKTRGGVQPPLRPGAHPHSRGENASEASLISMWRGSSPLTRGKPPRPPNRSRQHRLIPTHAGKTLSSRQRSTKGGAHPHSRGENMASREASPGVRGSSPLTRGKPRGRSHRPPSRRLIPTHAGKTLPDLRFYRADRSDLGKP